MNLYRNCIEIVGLIDKRISRLQISLLHIGQLTIPRFWFIYWINTILSTAITPDSFCLIFCSSWCVNDGDAVDIRVLLLIAMISDDSHDDTDDIDPNSNLTIPASTPSMMRDCFVPLSVSECSSVSVSVSMSMSIDQIEWTVIDMNCLGSVVVVLCPCNNYNNTWRESMLSISLIWKSPQCQLHVYLITKQLYIRNQISSLSHHRIIAHHKKAVFNFVSSELLYINALTTHSRLLVYIIL